MLTPLTQKASTLHLFWDSALKKQILAYFWDWHCFVLLRVLKLWPEFSTKFFESWNDEYSQDGTGLKVSKHLFVMQPLTSLPLAHVPYFTPLLLYLPLHAPDSNAPSRDACTDGPAAACSPSGSSWHGRLFWPAASAIIPSRYRSPRISVLASRPNVEVHRLSQTGCWAAQQPPGTADNRETAKYHTCHYTRCNKTRPVHYCWVMVGVHIWGAEHNRVHCILRKHIHAHLHPRSGQAQDRVTVKAFRLYTHSSVFFFPLIKAWLGLKKKKKNHSQGSTGTHSPKPFQWNSP